jgi:hypothetical protein
MSPYRHRDDNNTAHINRPVHVEGKPTSAAIEASDQSPRKHLHTRLQCEIGILQECKDDLTTSTTKARAPATDITTKGAHEQQSVHIKGESISDENSQFQIANIP